MTAKVKSQPGRATHLWIRSPSSWFASCQEKDPAPSSWPIFPLFAGRLLYTFAKTFTEWSTLSPARGAHTSLTEADTAMNHQHLLPLRGLLALSALTILPWRAQGAPQDSCALKKALRLRLDVSQTSFANRAQGADNSLAYVSGLNLALSQDLPRAAWPGKPASAPRGREIPGTKSTSVRSTPARARPCLTPTFPSACSPNPPRAMTTAESRPCSSQIFGTPRILWRVPALAWSLLGASRAKWAQPSSTPSPGISTAIATTNTPERIERVKVESGLTARTDLYFAVNSNLKFGQTRELF